MRRLVHVCCANCLADVADELAKDSELVLLYSNPNIHPLVEWRKRLKSVRLLAGRLGMALHEEPYGLCRFLDAAQSMTADGSRCHACYSMRLRATAGRARELGCDQFTTTLLVSRHQDGSAIREAGEAAAQEKGVTFVAPELGHFFGSGGARPADLHLYRQSYCGCIFSEEERFSGTSRGF